MGVGVSDFVIAGLLESEEQAAKSTIDSIALLANWNWRWRRISRNKELVGRDDTETTAKQQWEAKQYSLA